MSPVHLTVCARRSAVHSGNPVGPNRICELPKAETLPGYVKSDYLDEETFWGVVESARETATALAGRIREGDVHHDPRGGDCPTWCDLWTMCRIERP